MASSVQFAYDKAVDFVIVGSGSAGGMLAKELSPATGAYHEIWLDGERHLSTRGELTRDEEPFYGKNYLPRKFKTGMTHSGDNSIDVYSYDCGLVAILDGTRVTGFNVLVGGGMGMTHKKADT